jgi:hypothetical protein
LAFPTDHNTQPLFLKTPPSCISEFWTGQSENHTQTFLLFTIFLNQCVCDKLTLDESGANHLFSSFGCFFLLALHVCDAQVFTQLHIAIAL